jgi:hypothetical protein
LPWRREEVVPESQTDEYPNVEALGAIGALAVIIVLDVALG